MATGEVIAALNALYQGTTLAEREQANAWLEQFQKTTQAWTTADAILGSAELGLEPKLFAAQTLRNKVISSFGELGEQGALSLRDSVVAHLRNARSGPQPLVTQLCLALADLAVQLEAWEDPFGDMTRGFLSDPQSVSCLLEFLAVLPEEALNERIMLTTELYAQRSAKLLTQRAGDLIQLLVQCLQQPDLQADAHTRVLVCFTSWLKNGEITLAMIQDTPLVELSFAALKAEDSAVFDTAVDAICGIIYETHVDRDDEPGVMQMKTAAVERQLVPQLAAVAAQMRTDALVVADGDEERMQGYCRVFTEAGEAWVSRIVVAIGVFEPLVAALADCMRFDSLDVIAMMFDFWSTLADRTMECTSSCDPARRALAAVFETIIDITLGHLKYPQSYDTNDIRGGMTAKERDEFREFRHNIGDVLKDCVRVVGQAKALSHPYAIIAAGIEGAAQQKDEAQQQKQQQQQQQQQLPWQDIEAALFALRAMGAEIDAGENEVLPKIMDMFARFPAHPKLRYAATLVIGRYTEWTYEHPQYVQFQLNYIAEGFKVREVAAASAQSLKYLCQDCAKYLAGHWADLLGFFNEVASSGTLDESDVLDFSAALAHVVSAVPEPGTAAAIESFCMPVGQELGALLQLPELGDAQKQKIALLLHRLCEFLRYVSVEDNEPAEQLLARLVAESWTLVGAALQRLAADPLVSEGAVRFVRVLVDFYVAVLRPMAPQVVEAVVQAFRQTGLGAYLWAARRIVAVAHGLAANEAASLQLVAGMVEQLSESALALFQRTPFSDVPDTTEDYFRLLERAVEAAPGYVVSLPSFGVIFQAAVAALEVNQFRAQMAVVRAWQQLLGPAKRHIVMARDRRAPLQLAAADAAAQPPLSASAPPSPRRPVRRSAAPDAYPVEQVVRLCADHGFDLAAKLVHGLMQRFDREVVSEAADVFASLAAIASDGPAVAAAQFDRPPAPTMYEWMQALLSQIPDARFPPAEKQALLAGLSENIHVREWPRLKMLIADSAAVFWRRNAARS
ncbi:Nuclear import receptor [Coemansia javaensis]|uniref:Nuclear import receptor n=1 Tax=Coemansia javaensis TaxID=2761396 RepID=A0A9W8H8P7_9FUNG|nr:Nuclear import receptor [Coemansia javaensis]